MYLQSMSLTIVPAHDGLAYQFWYVIIEVFAEMPGLREPELSSFFLPKRPRGGYAQL
jgi:hypothetical protein